MRCSLESKKHTEDVFMNKSDLLQALKKFFLAVLPKFLLFYALAPALCVIFLGQPIGRAACHSGTAVFLVLLAALAAVILNWLVYKAVQKKWPSLLVYSYGILCLLITAFIQHEALPTASALRTTLAMVCGSLALLYMLVLSHWFASFRGSKAALALAVGLRIAFGVVLFFVLWQILRDIEIRHVTRDTWLTLGILILMLLAAAAPRLRSACRVHALHRRATGLATGTLTRIIGETHLDLDDDPVTLFHCTIQYTVNDVSYETHADATRFILRKYGKENFLGRKIPVFYDPADPASSYVNQIDKHVLDYPKDEPELPEEGIPAV